MQPNLTSEKEKELKEIVDQRIEEKKDEIKKEAKKEAREELKQEIADNTKKEKGNSNMSRRDFLKKAGIGAAGLGALSLSPAAANLKLTKNGIFESGTVNTNSLNVNKKINYWLPVRIDRVNELETTSPATSYTSLTLSAPPSDASVALVRLYAKGDGSSNSWYVNAREANTSRTFDHTVRGYASPQEYDGSNIGHVPMDGSKIEYTTGRVQKLFIQTTGYY